MGLCHVSMTLSYSPPQKKRANLKKNDDRADAATSGVVSSGRREVLENPCSTVQTSTNTHLSRYNYHVIQIQWIQFFQLFLRVYCLQVQKFISYIRFSATFLSKKKNKTFFQKFSTYY